MCVCVYVRGTREYKFARTYMHTYRGGKSCPPTPFYAPLMIAIVAELVRARSRFALTCNYDRIRGFYAFRLCPSVYILILAVVKIRIYVRFQCAKLYGLLSHRHRFLFDF